MKRILTLLLVGVLMVSIFMVSIFAAPSAHAAPSRGGPMGAVTVLVGQGQVGSSPGSALIFTPRYVDITVGETVVWRSVDAIEPHTVSFGPMTTLEQIANNPFHPVPQKNGPPLLAIDPRFVRPTTGNQGL